MSMNISLFELLLIAGINPGVLVVKKLTSSSVHTYITQSKLYVYVHIHIHLNIAMYINVQLYISYVFQIYTRIDSILYTLESKSKIKNIPQHMNTQTNKTHLELLLVQGGEDP